jgi:FMN phosphatase YigB (HAD superfamily)
MLGVVFALGGTLGSDDGLYAAAFRGVVRELIDEGSIALDERDFGELVERVGSTREGCRSGLNALVPLLRAGALSAPTLIARFRMIAVELVPRYFRIFDDVGATLEELHELGVPQAVVAEGWSGIDHAKARFATFEGAVFPAEDAPGGDSRSLSTFALIAAKLRLPADRLWFVGAQPERDIAPARAAGFQTVWLNRDGATYPSYVARPDHTIGRLEEFLALIGEPYTKSALALREIFRTALHFRPGHFIPADPLRED